MSAREDQALADPLEQPAAVHPVDGALSWLPSGKVLREYVLHPARLSIIMGPYGSGKTTASFMKLLMASAMVPQSPVDGVRYARSGIIRDTYRNLELNTIPSWEERFPRDLGTWRGGGGGEPARARIRWRLNDGTELDWEVIFVAIGDHNVKEFCDGLQLTNCFANGIDALPRELATTHMPFRLGRFPPPKHRPADWKAHVKFWRKFCGDMNAPERTNWTYEDCVKKLRDGWAFFEQPGGMDPDAENLDNLEDGYYADKIASMDEWDAQRFVHNKWGYSRAGLPVYREWSNRLHIAEHHLKFDPARPLLAGVDGGRDCCAIFGQKSVTGRVDILAELIPETRMGARQFGDVFLQYVADNFPDVKKIVVCPDPATDNPNDLDDDNVWLDIFLDAAELTREDIIIPETNAFTARREAVAKLLSKNSDGAPLYRVDPRCEKLIEGYNSGYRYEISQTREGDKKTHDMPIKNAWSHPHDANQYLAMGSGDSRVQYALSINRPQTVVETHWDPFD